MIVDREQRTRALRYKRPALASMSYEHINGSHPCQEPFVPLCSPHSCLKVPVTTGFCGLPRHLFSPPSAVKLLQVEKRD